MLRKISDDKQLTLESVQMHAKDVGSTLVQIHGLNKRIKLLSAHLTTHKKDKHSSRGLLMMVAKRRKLVKYAKQHNLQ